MKRILFFLLLLPAFSFAQLCADEDTVRANAVTLITYNSARVNGTTGHFAGTVLSISLKYVRVGQTDTATSTSAGVNALRNITGLQANTLYVYYYISTCGSGTVKQSVAYTFTTLANTVNYTPMAAMGYQFKYLKADSGLMAPRRDTTIGRAPNYGGQIVWKPEDSTFYGYNGEYWHPLAIDSAGIISLLNDKVDSVTVAGDSLWYWKLGVSYGYILPTQANEWKLVGNAGTTAGTNFIGTTDNMDLVFKRNSVESGRFSASGNLNLGLTGTTSGGLGLSGSTSGLISILPQAAAGTYNFNLPTTAGTSGYLLTSAGGGASPMTWTDPASYATNIYNSDGTLTGNRVVELDGNSLEFSDMSGNNNTTFSSNDDTYINIKTPIGGLVSGINFYNGATASGGIYDNGGQIAIQTVRDKISMLPYAGLFYIDTLNYSANADDSMMVWSNANGGAVGMRAIPSGGSGANTALSNLASVAINTSLISDADNTDDLGSTSVSWRTGYFGTTILPDANDGAQIGSTTRQWSDLFLAEGGVINWDNGDATLTQAGNTLTLAGADLYSSTLYGSSANLAGALGLTISSTSAAGAANKGVIKIGTFAAFDEYYETMGIGLQNSVVPLHIKGSSTTYNGLKIENTNSGSYARQDWVNNNGDLTQMLLAGSAYNSGIFTANSASFFNNGAGGTNIGGSHATTGHIRFFTRGTGTVNEKIRISSIGNLLIGGTADPTSSVAGVAIFNGTAPTASVTDGTILYSEDVTASSELKVRDEAGNITVLSPHNFSQLGKPSEDLAWSYYSEKDGKYITVDMAKAIRTIEDLSERVSALEKELNLKAKPPVKLLYKGKVKKK